MIDETIEQIELRLDTKFRDTEPFKSLPISGSNVAMWSNFLNTIATEIFTLQQLNNTFEAEIEAIIASAIPATSEWIKAQVEVFQYPDVATLNEDYTIGYGTIDEDKQINTGVAVVPISGIINIKAQKGDPKVPLTGPESTALIAYCDLFLPAGAVYNIISVITDTLQINVEVFYNGQYASTITASVEAALTAYMDELPFNGVVKNSDIEKAIFSVEGVTDVVLEQVTATPNGGTAVNLVLAKTELVRSYQTYSGSIENAAAPNDLANTITYTIANT